YANEDTGYTIARVATERTGPDLLTVTGPLLGAQVGESLRLTGRWGSHPRYGRQFQVHSCAAPLHHPPARPQDPRRPPGRCPLPGGQRWDTLTAHTPTAAAGAASGRPCS